ncbi:MAG: hypothetical protein EOO11_17190 [Chitinophagaceae bacterium]|nr:MAG: hypothetical protein EOO11_17190 [Chitinophagaceae bacterium]
MSYAISLKYVQEGGPLFIRYENQSAVTGTRYARELTDSALASGFRLVGVDTFAGSGRFHRTVRTRLESDAFRMEIGEAAFEAPVPTRKRRSTEKLTEYWYFISIRRK